ncbi:MAG: terminase family protein [Clostridiales bacterium]|nr:terminase family protein [Clostridiales bacterium]
MSMQREEILKRIAEIDGELKKRRQANRLNFYNAGRKKHKKQIAFHKCKKRNRWVFGGNRSGKTECGAVECLWMLRGIHPYRKNRRDIFGWCVSLSQQVQRDVAQAKILHYLPKSWIADIVMLSGRRDSPSGGVIDQIKIKNIFGGISTLGFKSCDQGREKFQGSSLDFVWFDEEPPRDIYEECVMRIMDKRGDIFGTMTPLKGKTFIYSEIYLNIRKNPEIWHEFMTWEDNPFLAKKEIELLENSLDKSALDSRRYGRFSEGQGLVYPEFDENVHVIEPFDVPKEWQDTISIDPGLNNPLSAHWYCVDWDGNVYVVAEHFAAGKDVDFHAQAIHGISSRLGWKADSKGRLRALIDSAANQRTLASVKSVTELFSERGILVNPSVNKDIFAGISRVKSFLKQGNGEGNLYIFSNCVNMIEEFKGYFWAGGDTPVKRDDHCMDELRYYIMTRPVPPQKEREVTAVERDKLNRIKRLKNKRIYE